jgi:hypothetical protein
MYLRPDVVDVDPVLLEGDSLHELDDVLQLPVVEREEQPLVFDQLLLLVVMGGRVVLHGHGKDWAI